MRLPPFVYGCCLLLYALAGFYSSRAASQSAKSRSPLRKNPVESFLLLPDSQRFVHQLLRVPDSEVAATRILPA
jgi:hypothetical protein